MLGVRIGVGYLRSKEMQKRPGFVEVVLYGCASEDNLQKEGVW